MMRVLFITPTQPSSNPRMFKSLVVNEGSISCKVLYRRRTVWASVSDSHLISQLRNVHFDCVNPENAFLGIALHHWLNKAYKLIASIILKTPRSSLLDFWPVYFYKGLIFKPDIIVGHNPQALRISMLLSKLLACKFIIDIEDFYRDEGRNSHSYNKAIINIEHKVYPAAVVCSVASRISMSKYAQIFPNVKFKYVPNALLEKDVKTNPRLEFTKHDLDGLTLVWFSQTIGPNRGLNTLLLSQKILLAKGYKLKIHLIGEMSEGFHLDDSLVNIHPPMNEKELLKFVDSCELGYCGEEGTTMNSQIAESNKWFTYIARQCLPIASSTPGHLGLISMHGVGLSFENGCELSLANTIENIYQNPKLLNEYREKVRLLNENMNYQNFALNIQDYA